MSLFTYKRLHVVLIDPVDPSKRHDFVSPILQGSDAERHQILRAFRAQVVAQFGRKPERRDILLEETIETSLPEPEPAPPEPAKPAALDESGRLRAQIALLQRVLKKYTNCPADPEWVQALKEP